MKPLRQLRVHLAAFVLLASSVFAAEPARPKASAKAAPKPKLAPSLNWAPRVGQTANTWSRDGSPVVATGDHGSAEILAKAVKANDAAAIQRLKDTNTAFDVPSGTKVKITDMIRERGSVVGLLKTEVAEGKDKGATAWFPWGSVKALVEQAAEVGSIVKVGKPKDSVILARGLSNYPEFAYALRYPASEGRRRIDNLIRIKVGTLARGGFTAIVLDSGKVGGHASLGPAIKVRIINGPDKDSEGWVNAEIAKLIAAPDESGLPGSKSEALLKLARQLENSGDRESAIEFYREIVNKYPGSSESANASARINALGAPP